MRMEKKNFPQIIKSKKIQTSRFIKTELDSDAELMAKLKSVSDNDSE